MHLMCRMHPLRWILRSDSEAGVDMFVQMRPALQPSVVLPIVQVCAFSSVLAFLGGLLLCSSKCVPYAMSSLLQPI
jgi:Na+(H+)/acetate symporter ActP